MRVAGSRLSLLFAALATAAAREESLFTSSVSYCAPPDVLLIQQFEVEYFAANASVSFNISASSVVPNLNVSANLLLNVYGMQPVNLTIDLCSILGGALCPLPTYNFTGADSIQLPSSVDVDSHIPGIAYKIPDLEAFAQLTLTDSSTGQLKACVQSTLSNGWSTRQPAVEWTTAAFALLAFLSAVWFTRSSQVAVHSTAAIRFLDLMFLYQAVVTMGLLNLDYPLVFRSFVLNFSWAMALLPQSPTSNIQEAINNMRHKTGGSMADASAGSATELVNRKFSPYNVPGPGFDPAGNVRAFLAKTVSSAKVQDVATVTAQSSNILEAGVPVYVNSLGIGTANAFMTVFLTLLILSVILLGVLGLAWLLVRFLHSRSAKFERSATFYPSFAKAWFLRLSLAIFLPITLFTFVQWTLKDSWLSILLSVIAFLAVSISLLYPTTQLILIVKRHTAWGLYTDSANATSTGPLFSAYRHQRWSFIFVFLFATLCKSAFVAFGHNNGFVQIVAFLIVEVVVLGLLVVLKPHSDRRADTLAIFLAVIRVVSTGMMFAFVERFNVKAIPRVAIGITIAVFISIAVLVMFVNTIINTRIFSGFSSPLPFSRIKSFQNQGALKAAGDSSILEKGTSSVRMELKDEGAGADGDRDIARPDNPTPHRFIPLDPNVNRPYPEITPTPTTASLSAPPSASGSSVYPPTPSYEGPYPGANSSQSSPVGETSFYPSRMRRDTETEQDQESGSVSSGSTTLGSELPRRPLFSGRFFDSPGPSPVLRTDSEAVPRSFGVTTGSSYSPSPVESNVRVEPPSRDPSWYSAGMNDSRSTAHGRQRS